MATGRLFRFVRILIAVISFSFGAVHAQQQAACDFTSGSGFFTTSGGGKADFGLAAGVKNGAFWGHLNYVDSGAGLKLKADSITAYYAVAANTRVVEGVASTNVFGSRTYKVTATDNGPDGGDIFQIELDNGYFARGDLSAPNAGGDIRITPGNASSTPPAGYSCYQGQPDTEPPSVSITSPANGATVTGVVTVSASASDNVGIAGVQFQLDGVNLGAEDTTAPYSLSWDTTRTNNGSHTLTAIARDTSANTTTSSPVSVTVSNLAPSTGVTRFEENDPAVTLTGNWVANTHSLHSGGRAVLAMDTGSRAGFTFNGTGVKWIGYRDEWSGIADVFLDGVFRQRVDTFASPFQAQAVLFSVSGLAAGAHSLVIEVTGTHTLTSLGAWIWVDAFEVESEAAPSPADTTPPTVNVTAPANGSTVSGTVTVTANASDNVGVVGVQFRLDGNNLGAEDTTAPYSISWDTTTTFDGTHTLTAVARDAAGNIATSSAVTVTVSNAQTAPGGIARFEENDAAVNYTGSWFGNISSGHSGSRAVLAMDAGSRALFTFNGTGVAWIGYRDEWSGIARVLVDGIVQGKGTVDTFASPAQSQAVLFLARGLSPGTHELIIEATGTRNPPSAGSWVWVDAFDTEEGAAAPPPDTTPPAVTITSPANGSTVSGTITVTADASDNVAVAQVQFKLDGANLGAADTTAPYAVTWDTTTAANGTHTLTAAAADTSGNTATSSPVTVTVNNAPSGDTTPPTVAITSPANGSTVSGTITVTAEASDNVGVAQVQFQLDGANLGPADTTAPYSVIWDTTTVADGTHTLTAIATDTSGNTAGSSPVTVAVSNAPAGPGFQPGDIFVSLSNGEVQWRGPGGTLKQTLTSGTDGVAGGMGFDASGNLYVTHFFGVQTVGNTVARFDPKGNQLGNFGETCAASPQTPFPPSCYFSDPESIDFGAAGNVYVGQADDTQDILKFDAAGNLLARFDAAVEVRGSDWIDLAPDGCTIFYTSRGQNVLRFNVCTNTQLANFNTALLPGPNAYTVRILPDGGLLVANSSVIARLDAAGNLVQTYDDPARGNVWFGLDLVGDGTFWAADTQTKNVAQFDLATGAMLASFNTGTVPFPVGVAVKK